MAAPVCGVQPGGAARGMPLPPPGRAAGRVTAGPQEARGGRAEPQRLDRTKAAFHRPPHRRAPNCLGEKFISERGAAFERAQRSVCGTRTAPAALGAAGGGRHCPLLAPGGCRGPYGTGTVRPSGARRARSPDPCSAPGICSPSIRALVFNQNSIRNMIPGDYIWRDLRYISCRRDRLQRSPGRAGGRDNLHLARLTFNKKGGKVIKNTSLKAPGGYLRACLSSIPKLPGPAKRPPPLGALPGRLRGFASRGRLRASRPRRAGMEPRGDPALRSSGRHPASPVAQEERPSRLSRTLRKGLILFITGPNPSNPT